MAATTINVVNSFRTIFPSYLLFSKRLHWKLGYKFINQIKIKTLNLGAFSENAVNHADKYKRRGTELDNLLITNLASKMAAKLSFQSNLEFTGNNYLETRKSTGTSCQMVIHFSNLFNLRIFALK